MKKATMFVAAAALVISLAGCSSQTEETEVVTEQATEAAAETEEAAESETEEVAEAESETEEVTEAESESETEEATEAESETEATVEAEHTALLLIDDVEENTAFNESAQDEMDTLTETLGEDVLGYISEGLTGADEDELTQEFLDYCESGDYDVIVVATSKLEAAVEEAQQEYPEITFVFLDEAYPEEVSETLAGLEEEFAEDGTASSEAETEEASEAGTESETETETESEIGEEA